MVLRWAEPRLVGTIARQPLRVQVRPELWSERAHLGLIAPGEALRRQLPSAKGALSSALLSVPFQRGKACGQALSFYCTNELQYKQAASSPGKGAAASWFVARGSIQRPKSQGRWVQEPGGSPAKAQGAVPQAFARGCAAAGWPCSAQGRLQVRANRGGGNWI